MSKRNRRIEKTIKELRGNAERLRRLDWDILAQTIGVDEAHNVRNEAKKTSVLLGVVANTLDLMHIPEDLTKQLKTAPLEKVEIHSADGGSPVVDSILLHEKYGDSEEYLGSLESGIRRERMEDIEQQLLDSDLGAAYILDESVESNVRREDLEASITCVHCGMGVFRGQGGYWRHFRDGTQYCPTDGGALAKTVATPLRGTNA